MLPPIPSSLGVSEMNAAIDVRSIGPQQTLYLGNDVADVFVQFVAGPVRKREVQRDVLAVDLDGNAEHLGRDEPEERLDGGQHDAVLPCKHCIWSVRRHTAIMADPAHTA